MGKRKNDDEIIEDIQVEEIPLEEDFSIQKINEEDSTIEFEEIEFDSIDDFAPNDNDIFFLEGDEFINGEEEPINEPVRPNSKVKDVANWIQEQFDAHGDEHIAHYSMARRVHHIFEGKFTGTNQLGNLVIKGEVYKILKNLTPKHVWSTKGFYWRKSREGDNPKSRRVEY